MSHDHNSSTDSNSLWSTYFGKGGSAVVAFLWICAAIAWIISVLNWG